MSIVAAKPRAKEGSMQSGPKSSLMDGIERSDARSSKGGKSSGGSAKQSFDAKSIAMAVGGVAILLVSGFLIVRGVGGLGSNLGDATRSVVAGDSESGRIFENYRIKDGDSWPWKHPSTGNRTLYPAEACYWTSDGQAKLEPTYVVLNSIMGKEGPTTCPDCGREVVAHNPMPPADLLVKAAERAKSGGN